MRDPHRELKPSVQRELHLDAPGCGRLWSSCLGGRRALPKSSLRGMESMLEERRRPKSSLVGVVTMLEDRFLALCTSCGPLAR
mmetsp:Transcript_120228/g.256590  ORF Transcript_120228/g.256590 Transcript_120228/m.256590 type:complete len:83 (-) Transcript_120228:367-615(-)